MPSSNTITNTPTGQLFDAAAKLAQEKLLYQELEETFKQFVKSKKNLYLITGGFLTSTMVKLDDEQQKMILESFKARLQQANTQIQIAEQELIDAGLGLSDIGSLGGFQFI